MRREEENFNFMFEKCEVAYKNKDWNQLAINCVEAFSIKMRMLLLERKINPSELNAKQLMDIAIQSKIVKNDKIHQIRMIRNDIAHNGKELDLLDHWIILITYKYLKSFFKRQKFSKDIFKEMKS
jgi:hypothetical protein